MELNIVRGDNAALVVGGNWSIEFFTSEGGYTEPSDATIVITQPDGTTLTPEFDSESSGGNYLVAVPVTQDGRYTANISAYELENIRYISAYALEVTPADEMPNAADVVTYLESAGTSTSYSTDDINDVLAAEAAAQRSVCRVGASYPPDLRRALLRRVQRALAMVTLPFEREIGENGTAFVPGRDPEVVRLERPHRRVPIG